MKQNTEQLKKEFDVWLKKNIQDTEDYGLSDGDWDKVFGFFLPHLISSDEIKREAEYRTTYAPILEKSAVHRFIEDLDDRTIYDKEELLGIWAESYLTQSKEGGE